MNACSSSLDHKTMASARTCDSWSVFAIDSNIATMPDLDHEVFGECQAALINLEDLLVSEFGQDFAMTVSLAWSLQFSRSSPTERRRASRATSAKNHQTL